MQALTSQHFQELSAEFTGGLEGAQVRTTSIHIGKREIEVGGIQMSSLVELLCFVMLCLIV